jgi:hypothetical protein
LELGGSLEVADVLYVPELKMNFLSVSTMEDSGYAISFEDGRVLIWLKGSDIDSARVFGVREGKVYRLQGELVGGSKGILDHGLMLLIEDEEEAQKGE